MQVAGASPGFTSEIKFLIDAAVGSAIRDWARERLPPDPHGGGAFSDEYLVSSLYFDTSDRDVFYRRGSYARSKYRIRRYHQEPNVFLERKLRIGSRLAKRRSTLDLGALPLLASLNGAKGDGTAWFRRRVALRNLQPICLVSYLRTARIGETPDGPARLTLDYDMVASASDVLSFTPGTTIPLLEGSMILELKYRGTMPAVFRQLVERFALRPRRASKYRVAAGALRLVEAPPGEPSAIHV